MKRSQRRPSILFNLILLVGLAAIWSAFAPTTIGGQASYVMVDGISMEPGYHGGDLIVLRKAQTYQVGDVVTYRDPRLGAYVIHRIIGIEEGQFELKGDNNSWVDAYHPTHAEVLGKQWIYAPKMGRVMQWFRQPIHLSLVIVLLGGIFMAGMINKSPRNQNGKSRGSIHLGGMLEGTLYALGLTALAFIGLSVFAFTRPLTRAADSIPYQQEGNYFYSAAGTPGVYDTDTVRTGEPVFPALTCFLNIGVSYNVLGGGLQNVSGSHQMYARIMDEPSGWQRTIPLVPQTAFTGSSYLSMASLDLCQLTALVNMVEAETGMRTNTYTVEIISNIAVAGTASGQALSDTLDPNLVFKFDKVHFYLASDGAGLDPMHFSKDGLVGASGLQPNTLSWLGWKPTVLSVRVIALIGLGLSLTVLLAAGWYFYRTAHRSEAALIQMKYGSLLMDVYERMLEPATACVDVTSIDDLARLAERQNAVILHVTRNFLHYYMVQYGGVTYRYVISTGAKGAAALEPLETEIWPEAASAPDELAAGAEASPDDMLGYLRIAQRSGILKSEPPRTEMVRRIVI